jgi:xanthine/uracil permease
MLAKVDWDERSLAIAGFTLMLGFGSLFIEPKTLAAMPLFVSLLLRQPIIVGVFSLLLLSAVLPGGRRIAKKTASGGDQAADQLPPPLPLLSTSTETFPHARPEPARPDLRQDC